MKTRVRLKVVKNRWSSCFSLKTCNNLSLSLKSYILWHRSKGIKWKKKPWSAHAKLQKKKKKKSAYTAGSWPNKRTTYLLFTGSSLLPKDSCGPETADKHTKPASFFIWARHWLQMPQDTELNHKHSIVWCNLSSSIQCKHAVVTPLLIGSVQGWQLSFCWNDSFEGPCLGETSGHWE